MALFRNLANRHLMVEGKRTCIALEPAFWRVADEQAEAEGLSWQQWAAARIDMAQAGRASRLRVAILEAAAKVNKS